jgi:hypothetical protein
METFEHICLSIILGTTTLGLLVVFAAITMEFKRMYFNKR